MTCISTRVEICPIQRTFRLGQCTARVAIPANLNPYVMIPIVDKLSDTVGDLFRATTTRMPINRCRLTTFSTQKLIDGHTRLFSFDIPEGFICTGDRIA